MATTSTASTRNSEAADRLAAQGRLAKEYEDVLRLRRPWSETAQNVHNGKDLAVYLRQFQLRNGFGPSARASIEQMTLSRSEAMQCRCLLKYLARYAELHRIPPSLKLYSFTKWDAYSFDRFLAKSRVSYVNRRTFRSLLDRIWDHAADREQKIREVLERERLLILGFRDRFPEYKGVELHISSPLPNPWRSPAKQAAPRLPRPEVRRPTLSSAATRKADWFARRLAWKLRRMAERGVILSDTAVAKYLNQEGFEGPRGGRWTPASVKRSKDRIEAIHAKRR